MTTTKATNYGKIMPMRSVFSFSCLITLFLSCIHPVSGMDGTECINNLTTIALEEALTENTMERRTYVLCTDIVYNVGVLDVDGRIFDGFFPLAVKGNATVRCGDDGQRDNNCRVFLGDVGAVLAPFQANNLDPIDFGSGEGVVIEGLTFDSLLRAPVFMDQVYGNIDFINCAFLNSVAEPNIHLGSASPSRRRNRRLMSLPAGQVMGDDDDDYDDDEEWKTEYVHFREGLVLPNFKRVKGDHVHKKRRRRLSQTDPLPQLNVNFYNCVFQGNYGPRNFQYDSGLTLIYMPGPDVNLYMRRCSFDSNDFPQYAPPRPQAITKALITSFGDNNRIVVEDSCFTNNAVTGFGIGQSWNMDVTLNNNFIDPVDPALACSSFAHVALGLDGNLEVVNCLQDASSLSPECELLSPTMAPSLAPTRKKFEFCLSAHSIVQVKGRGSTQLRNVLLGDYVLVGGNKYEPIYSFGHLEHHAEAEYLQIVCDSSRQPLEITPDHMVFVEGHEAPVPASQVRVGDKLILADSDSSISLLPPKTTTVQRIHSEIRRGMYAPFTPSGTIVVNGILVSTFVAFQGRERLVIGGIETPLSYQWLAHSFEAPHRVATALGFGKETYTAEGVSNWVATGLALTRWFLKQHVVVMVVLLIPLTALLSTFMFVEALILGNTTTVLAVALTMVAAAVGTLSVAGWSAVRRTVKTSY